VIPSGGESAALPIVKSGKDWAVGVSAVGGHVQGAPTALKEPGGRVVAAELAIELVAPERLGYLTWAEGDCAASFSVKPG
jgi:hypothetical protein